jgi:hypothetical protein
MQNEESRNISSTKVHQGKKRKKNTKHAKSNAHVTATNILKERQKRKIQSSTGLSVAQHQSAILENALCC